MPFGGLLTAGIMIAGSAIGGDKSSRTSTQDSTSTFTPEQSTVQGATGSAIMSNLDNPSSVLDPLQSQAAGQINQNYTGLANNMDQQLSARGFGRSGKVGTNLTQNELSRQSDLGSLASRFAGYNLDLRNEAIQEGNQFGFADPGKDTTTVGAGSALASALGTGGSLASQGIQNQGPLADLLGGG